MEYYNLINKDGALFLKDFTTKKIGFAGSTNDHKQIVYLKESSYGEINGVRVYGNNMSDSYIIDDAHYSSRSIVPIKDDIMYHACLFVNKKNGETLLLKEKQKIKRNAIGHAERRSNPYDIDILAFIPKNKIKFTYRSLVLTNFIEDIGMAIVHQGGKHTSSDRQYYNIIDTTNQKYVFDEFVPDLQYIGNGVFKYKSDGTYKTIDVHGNVSTDNVITQDADMWAKVSIGGNDYFLTRERAYSDSGYTLYKDYNYETHEFENNLMEFDRLYVANGGESSRMCDIYLELGSDGSQQTSYYQTYYPKARSKERTNVFKEKGKDDTIDLTKHKKCIFVSFDRSDESDCVYIFDSSNDSKKLVYKIFESEEKGQISKDFWHTTKNGELVFSVHPTGDKQYSHLIHENGNILTDHTMKISVKGTNGPLRDNGFFFDEHGDHDDKELLRFNDDTLSVEKVKFPFTPYKYDFLIYKSNGSVKHDHIVDDNGIVHIMDDELNDITPDNILIVSSNSSLCFIKNKTTGKCYVCDGVSNVESPKYELEYNGEPYYPAYVEKMPTYSCRDFIGFVGGRKDQNTGEMIFTLFCTNGLQNETSQTPGKFFAFGEFSKIELPEKSVDVDSAQSLKRTSEFTVTDKDTGAKTKYALGYMEDKSTQKGFLRVIKKRA